MAHKRRASGPSSSTHAINSQTGRPKRKNRKVSRPEFVDSSLIDVEMSTAESLSGDEEGSPVQPKRAMKRPRTPSPSPPPTDHPIFYHTEQEPLTDDDANGAVIRSHRPTVSLKLRIPPGYHGDIILNDIGILNKTVGQTQPGTLVHASTFQRITPQTTANNDNGPDELVDEEKRPTRFADLPPEIRNIIYGLVFVLPDGKKFDFGQPQHFDRSAAFLRSCRMVHEEGTSVLYGENVFRFERNRRVRAPFWEVEQKEIGFKDLRHFLEMVGPRNISFMKEVEFLFEDALQAATPYLSVEERRFTNDPQLIHCLRLLRSANLRRIKLNFQGRRMLMKSDTKFLRALQQIQADIVEIGVPATNWTYSTKVHPGVVDLLQADMTRFPPLYRSN